jgi:hypothetical protein
MEVVVETKRLISHRDVLLPATWRYLLKACWLFFPAIMFIFIALSAFWHLPQGRDLMLIVLEDQKYAFSPSLLALIIALLFWVIVTWYSTRIVAKAKDFQLPDHHHIWQIFLVQSPRVLAFTCITIVLFGFVQVELYTKNNTELAGIWWYLMLIGSYGLYYCLYVLWQNFLKQPKKTTRARLAFLRKTRQSTYLILSFGILVAAYLKTFEALAVFLFILQAGLVLLLIIRRDIDEIKKDESTPLPESAPEVTPHSKLVKKMAFIVLAKGDWRYFIFFCSISIVALAFYLGATIDLKFAIWIGSMPFLLLAFGVLLGFGNIITTVSVFMRLNIHIFFFIWSLLLGKVIDPHFSTLAKERVNKNASFAQRQTLKEYFINWVNHPDRKQILDDPEVKKYPVYFVIANGGASRSGYWVASVLSKLQDTSSNHFSKHLFCLSGASGGSVGNATFFNLLRSQKELLENDSSGRPFWNAATNYLESDFLTFTLSRALGRDLFRHVIPSFAKNTHDRADALALSLEHAPDRHDFLFNSFSTSFSQFITQKNDSLYGLPIFCINTTRMQDGSPAVISNIDMNDTNSYFNNRIDVLDLLAHKGEERDMKISTAVVLGASFPYLSPAGRIDCDGTGETLSHYFVDGGYFDNSGAGVVNEMLIAMNRMNGLLKTEPALQAYADKLDFYVLHITNTDVKKSKLHRINPFTNDLMSPVQTIMGSYGTQTVVNDQRLKNFLRSSYGDNSHYINIDLYTDSSTIKKFSMNWVISDYQRSRMDNNLLRNKKFRQECDKMREWRF